MIELLQYDFMQRALLAALFVGITAPVIGTFIVQRRLALLGDGIGHVALTGVALGFVTGTSPTLTAIVIAALGAVAIEIVRARGRTGGDVALALLFYGGIAGGVLLIGLSPQGGSASLTSYLFGSISTVALEDVVVIGILAVVVLASMAAYGPRLFVLCQDEELARAGGLPVRFLSMLLAVMAAVTVVVAMRVVGLLLVSALMVIPVAAAQQVARGFAATMALAVGFGVLVTLGGLSSSFYVEAQPGAVIVMMALAGFVLALAGGRFVRRSRFEPYGGRRNEEARA